MRLASSILRRPPSESLYPPVITAIYSESEQGQVQSSGSLRLSEVALAASII